MIAPTCFGPFGPSSGSLCRTLLKLHCNFSKVRHRLPDYGPNGPKHVGAIMR